MSYIDRDMVNKALKGLWKSTKEHKPKCDEILIVTIKDESGDTPYVYVTVGWYLKEADCWIVDNDKRRDVIAYMSLPFAYPSAPYTIHKLPSADVEPIRHGEWVKNVDKCGWHCSVCGEDNNYAYAWNCETGKNDFQDHYCPNCGAKMDEVSK